LNVVAVSAVDERLAVDAHAALGPQRHDDRIVELSVRMARLARQFLQRRTPAHLGIERDPHGSPSRSNLANESRTLFSPSHQPS
jgi:hypothetical protein